MQSAITTVVKGPITPAELERMATAGLPVHAVACEMAEMDFAGLALEGWKFERCDLRQTNFTGAMLSGTSWLSCRAALVAFAAADLSDAQFVGCDLNNANLRGSNLSEASFRSCKLTGADLSETRGLSTAVEETLLVHARWPGHSFRGQTLVRVDFGGADLRQCDFRQATFEDSSLRDARLDGARFDGADLRGADLGGLRLSDAGRFRGAMVSRRQAESLLGELGLKIG